MNKNSYDTTLMSIFRAVILGRIGLAVLSTLLYQLLPSWILVLILTIPLWDAIVLAVPLSIGWLRIRMEGRLLPLVLITATILPIVEQHLTIYTIQPNAMGRAGLTWQLFVILLIPLVVTAGQYSFRAVMLFALGTAAIDLMMGQLLYGSTVDLFQNTSIIIFFRTVAYLIIGYIVYRAVAIQRQKSEELAIANDQLARYAILTEELAISRERNRLARELHDTLSHTLSASSVQLEAIDTIWDINPEKAHNMLKEVRRITRNGLTETRQALRDLRSSNVEDMGLSLAIRHVVEAIAARGSLETIIDLPNNLDDLDRSTTQCIYRVIQEAVTNIVQHAEANVLAIHIKRDDNLLTLTIRDDGKGFNLNTVDKNLHFGIIGMQERVKLIGGTLTFTSEKGRGTLVQLELKLEPAQPQNNAILSDTAIQQRAEITQLPSRTRNIG